jgi:hypothetical protein
MLGRLRAEIPCEPSVAVGTTFSFGLTTVRPGDDRGQVLSAQPQPR